MKSETQVLNELSLESFAIIIGSLLNLNQRPLCLSGRVHFYKCASMRQRKASFETANYNQGQVLNDLEVRHWAPVVAILKLHAILGLGWLGVGDIVAFVIFGRVENL